MTNVLLYVLTVFFWGTSWLAIKFQLGVVAPEVSVLYRMAGAAAILTAYCVLARRPMRFSLRDHGFMALQGLFLFSGNYVLIYLGSQYLTSGLVAVAFSSIVVMNIAGTALLFAEPIRARVVLGAAAGIAGLTLVFWPEIRAFDVARDGTIGLALVMAGTFLASLGMLTSARNQKQGLPIVQSNAFGMTYGALALVALALGLDRPLNFDTSFPYVASLFYLAFFATVLAFGCYLTLLGRIGADRAAYASVLFPIVALALSTVFEGYQWTLSAALGLVMVLVGNALILTRGPILGRERMTRDAD
ncbi:MAG: DMT family transporter [Rhodospirillales bacterium]|jgi:drug/metabolite transporter (DMT)-like permease|nr:DMT family transporter [Rhodospirillales bacterium]HJO97611.1 DMT family transporter [Rhodospirillales bacterium]